MRINATIPDHGALVMAIMEGFVVAAEVEIKAGVVPPFPTDVPGLRFKPELEGDEVWLLPHQVLKAGGGDCEDLSFWEAAGMRVTGEDPQAAVVLIQTGKDKLHAVVLMSDGTYNDPSAVLRAAQVTSRRKTKVGDPIRITDHRTSTPTRASSAPPAAPPGATPAPSSSSMPSLAPLYKYMADHGMTSMTSDLGFTGSGHDTPVSPGPSLLAQGLQRIAAEADRTKVSRMTGVSRGKGNEALRDDATGLVTVQDDQTGDVFVMRPSEIDKAAWEAGMSPDELRAQLEYEQQYAQYGYDGGYPSFDQYGGYPNPFGGIDPYGSSYGDMFGGMGDFLGNYGFAVNPAEFYGDPLGLNDDTSADASGLGIDTSNVIDVDTDDGESEAA
jgi:hypothetical protein